MLISTIVCVLACLWAGSALAERPVEAPDAVLGPAVRTVLAADADRTVVQITFPVLAAPRDWQAVRTVDWSDLQTEVHDLLTDTYEPIDPVLSFHVAVDGRTAPSWRVAAVQWYREPIDPTAPVVDVMAPVVYRGVGLATAEVRVQAGGGILAGLVLEVGHPAPSGLAQAKSDPQAARRAARDAAPPSVVNREHFTALRAHAQVEATRTVKRNLPDYFGLTSNWVKLEVTEAGVHRLTGRDLELLGLGLSGIDPTTLRVYKGGGLELMTNPEVADVDQADRMGLTEVAIRVDDGGDGQFDADDRVVFYGFGTDVWRDRIDPGADRLEFWEHQQQNRGVYWLTWQGVGAPSPLPGEPRRVGVLAAAPTGGELMTTHLARYHGEQNLVYAAGWVRDRWLWQTLINAAFSPQAVLHGVVEGGEAYWHADVCGVSIDPFSYTRTIRVSAWTNNDQANAVEYSWTQNQQLNQDQVRIAGTTTSLRNGVNTLTLRYENFGQTQVYLGFDSFDLLYEATLDKTQYPGALTSVLWGDEGTAPGTPVDVRYTLPASGDLTVWDVTDPLSAVALSGAVSVGPPRTLTVGLMHDPEVDRHLLLFADGDMLAPVRMSLGQVQPLRQVVPAVDYVVIHPAAFAEAAERLADLRSRALPGVEDPRAVAIDVEQIYANFSGGQKDWRAIRQFLRWHWDTHGQRLRWVCLLGDASRDYRNNLRRNPATELVDWIPTDVIDNFRVAFPHPINIFHPYATDESLVALDSPDGSITAFDPPDLAVGRLPANNAAGALALVERARAYVEDLPPGVWRNHVTFSADDLVGANSQTETAHTAQAEVLANQVMPPSIDLSKVYLVDYPLVGRYKPAARRDLLAALDAGTTIFYYVGHGAANVLADEQIFLSDFIPGLTNGGRRFAFLAFSCDVGVYDDPGTQAMAEQFLESQQGGGIAAIAASWVSTINENNALSSNVFGSLYPERGVPPDRTMGEALKLGKVATWTGISRVRNLRRYNLIGDPAVRLPNPVDDLNFAAGTADTLRTGALHTVALDLAGGGLELASGQQYQLLAQESSVPVLYHQSSSTSFYWLRPGNTIFRGSGNLTAGQAQIPFLAPLSLRTGNDGRLRAIVSGGEQDRAAVVRMPVVQVGADTSHDVRGPDVRLTLGGGRVRVQPGATLTASLHDTSGVNILANNPANSVLLEFDGSGIYTNVSDDVVFAPGSYTRATMTTSLPPDLSLGQHTVVMTASDMFGNVGSDTLRFFLEAAGVGGLRDATVFPNPTPGPCRLVCDLSGPMDLRWDIYTVSGRRVRSLQGSFGAAGPAIVVWDGRDQEGDEIANGVYLYVLRGTMPGAAHEIRETGQVVIMR